MAENVNITPGSGDVIAADDIGGVKYQRVKLAWGVDGSAVDASASNPLPVVQTGTPTLATGAATSAKQDTMIASLASIDGKLPALGQALAAASVPVVLTAAQLTTLTPPAAITGFATESTLATRLTESDFDTKTGSLTETAPATDTASSGLNGRLQRIAQRITSLIALIPAALTGSGNFKVAIQEAVPAGTNNIGDVDVLTLPADPLGANADAAATAGGTGSLSAKLRIISGDMDAAKTALQIMDDWDETDRAKVNIIVGQAGITAGAGAVAANTPRITHASDDPTTVSLQLIDDIIFSDDAAFTPGSSKVGAIGMMADETSPDSVDEGDIGIPRMTLDRKQLVVVQAHTKGGATPYKLVSAASTNATSLKASAGQVYMITVSSVNAAARYLKLYNKASAPTVGTDTPVHTFIIPGNTAGAGSNIPIPACGLEFDTGIAFALTTEATDAGTTGVAASEIVVNIAYK